MIAIIDNAEEMESISISAAAINIKTGELEIIISKREKKTIDTHANKVYLKDNGFTVVYHKGIPSSIKLTKAKR